MMNDIYIDGRFKVMPTGKHVMSNEDYHSDKHYFSSSQIKHALNSPAHFKYYVMEENGRNKSTSAMELGSVVHTMVLELHLFDDQYIVHYGDSNKDGTVPKQAAKILENKHPGLTVISKSWYEIGQKARHNIELYPLANDLVYDKHCEYEVSYFTECPETGLKLRVRPDIINLEKKYIVDLKTTSSSGRSEFAKDAKWKYHYDLSAFMYQYAVYLMTGVVCDYYFCAVGKEDLVPVSIYKASDVFMAEGKDKFYKACDNIKSSIQLPDIYTFQQGLEEI